MRRGVVHPVLGAQLPGRPPPYPYQFLRRQLLSGCCIWLDTCAVEPVHERHARSKGQEMSLKLVSFAQVPRLAPLVQLGHIIL